VLGDARGEGLWVVDGGAAGKSRAIDVGDGNAFRLRHLRAAIVECDEVHPAPCSRCATGIQNRVWYSASVVMRMVEEAGMQSGPRCVVAVLQYRMCRDSSSEGFPRWFFIRRAC